MNRGQTRTSDRQQQQDKTQDKTTSRSKTKSKRLDLIHTREMVFSLSPLLLKEYIDLTENDETFTDLPAETDNDSEPEDTIDQETDLDIDDEDEFSTVEETKGDSTIPDYDILLGDAVSYKDSAALLTNAVYTITIAPAANGLYRCWFEGPAWFDRRLSPEIRAYVNKLRNFLDSIAKWLEEEKQAFLKDPSPENFVIGEADFVEKPVILHQGFLSRINKQIVDNFPYTEEEFKKLTAEKAWLVWPELDKSQFSRLKDNIWLIWPEWNMPLNHIFLPEYRLPWLVEVGTGFYKGVGERWLKDTLNYPDLRKTQLTVIKKKAIDKTTKRIDRDAFDTLSPEEKLHLLRAKIGCDIDTARKALKIIITRVREQKQGL